MELVWLSLRARLRHAWFPALVIALLIGVVGGFVLAAASAARRVDDAFQELLADIDAPDLMVVPACGSGGITGCTGPPTADSAEAVTAQLRQVEGVEQVRPVAAIRPYLITADGTPLLAETGDPAGCFDGDRSVSLLALRDGGPREQSPPFRLIGDLPQGDPNGVVVTRATAERVGLGIGSEVTVAGWCTGDGDPIELREPIVLVVTGLSIGAFDVEPPGDGLTVEPTFVDQTVLDALYAIDAERPVYDLVWLVDNSTADNTRELDGYDVVFDVVEQAANVDEALDSDARPLWILAAAGALTGILLLAPIIDRSIRDDTDDVATLVALGSTRFQIGLRATAHIVVLAAAGGLLSIILAPLIARVLPLGLADSVLTGGVWIDSLVMAVGTVLLFSIVAAIAAFSTWRLVAGPLSRRPVAALTATHAVGSLPLPPPTQTGMMAAVGRPAGRRLASPWPGLVSLILACTVCVGGLTYVAGIANLEQSPHLLGWNWDAVVSIDSDADDPAGLVAEIGGIEGVEQATTGTLWPPVFLGMPGSDVQVWPWSFATGPGAIVPTIMEGRAPEGPDEVAIDLAFRDLTGLGPGDTVQLLRPSIADQIADDLQHNLESSFVIEPPGDEPVVGTFEITGITVLSLERTQLIPQTSLTLAGLAAFSAPSDDEIAAARAWLPEDLPAEVYAEIDGWLSGPDLEDSVVYLRTSGDQRAIVGQISELDGVGDVIAPTPLEVVTLVNALNLADTDNAPLALTVLASVAAVALVTYLLATGMWARRREVAVLRALGVSSWGVRSSFVAQAIATVVIVLAIAVPIGVAIGQWAWLAYARDLRVVPEAAVPWQGLASLLVGALVVVTVVALVLAQFAVKRSASRELRAE